MSDNESENDSVYDSESESDIENVVLPKKSAKSIVFNHAKQFGGYVEDDSEEDESEPDDADGDDDDDENEEDEEQTGGVQDDIDSGSEIDDSEIKDEEEEDETVADEEPDDSDIEIDEDGVAIEKKSPVKASKPKKTTQIIIEDEEDDEDEYEENYLQKFDGEVNRNYIYEFHPECLNHNSDEIEKLAKVTRDENNIIIDPLHRTLPYLTKYEKARILGQRAKQIEVGAKPLVKVSENIIDGYIIAELELREKKIPFIIKRPIPGGAFEYWHLRDLENINF